MPASDPDPAAAPNRSRWMRQGRACMAVRDWAGAIRAYGQGLMEQPLLGMHYAANLERARSRYRQERHTINHQEPAHTQVVVAAAELSHNAAGRAYTLAQLYQHLGPPGLPKSLVKGPSPPSSRLPEPASPRCRRPALEIPGESSGSHRA